LRVVALFVGGLPVRKCRAPAELDGLATRSPESEAADVKRCGCLPVAEVGHDCGQIGPRRNSPLLNLPARAAKLIIAYGSDELLELKRQSREFGAAWSAHGLPGEIVEGTDCHHYAVLEQLAQPDGVLAKALAVAAGTDPD